MNLVNTCPDIPDSWEGGISDAAVILGLHRDTIAKKAKLGRRYGGIDWRPGKRGKIFTGKEIKRFWRTYR